MSDDGELWCFFRDLISQGTYIQMDYAAGKYKCYEELSARLDEAARERVAHFKANRSLQRQSAQETFPGRDHNTYSEAVGTHPSHKARFSDASSYDEICDACGVTDATPGGTDALGRPCPAANR